MTSVRRRATLVDSLEPRRLMAIESALAATYIDSDSNKLLQSLAAASVTGGTVPGSTRIVYADRDAGTGKGNDIFFRQFLADGSPTSAEVMVNTTTAGAQMNPDIAANDAGNFVVVWQSENQDGSGWGIYARVFNATTFAGSPQLGSGEILINQTTTGDQITPRVGIDASGNFVVTWLAADSNNGEIFARRFNASAVAQGGEFKVSGSTTPAYSSPQIAMQTNGTFAIAFEKTDAGDTDVQLQAFNAAGTTVGSTVTINSATTGNQSQPTLATAGSGYVVAWADDRTPEAAIYHRVFNNSGVAQTSATQTSQDSVGGRSRPKVAGDSSGNFTVGWTQQTDGELFSSDVMRSFNKNNVATSNELAVGDGSSGRTMFDVVQTGIGRFAEIATIGETVGYGVGTISSFANVLTINGTTTNGVDRDDNILVDVSDDRLAINIKNNGISAGSFVRMAYAYLHAELGGGNDLFRAEFLVVGSGNVPALPVSVHGGAGNDTLNGGGGGDSIFGDDGNDSLTGNASKDYIVGGDDNDTLHGNEGNDNLVGGAGKNIFYGEAGDDRLSGSGGHDTMFGGDDSDRLYGGGGDDSLDGGGGTDRLYAGDGNDILVGDSSNDRLYGEAGNDTLNGGKGTDYLFGGDGTDTRTGAESSDVLDSIEQTR